LSSTDEGEIQRELTKIGYLGESRLRSWVKSLTWRLIGIFVLGAIAWVITHDWQTTTLITIIFHVIRFMLYYFFERGWDRVSWGRIKAGE